MTTGEHKPTGLLASAAGTANLRANLQEENYEDDDYEDDQANDDDDYEI